MSTRENVEALNARILGGDILGAFEDYYAEDVVMSENGTENRVGKDENRKFEEAFVASVAEFHGAEVKSLVVEGDKASNEWFFDYTTTEGQRMTYQQVALQTWNADGKVISETFYHA